MEATSKDELGCGEDWEAKGVEMTGPATAGERNATAAAIRSGFNMRAIVALKRSACLGLALKVGGDRNLFPEWLFKCTAAGKEKKMRAGRGADGTDRQHGRTITI